MKQVDSLTDDLIEAAFQRRAGQAVPGELRELVIARTGAVRQRTSFTVRVQRLLSNAELRPAWVVLAVLAALLGLAIAAATIGQHEALPTDRSELDATPSPSSSTSATSPPSEPARPSGVIGFTHYGGRFSASGFESSNPNETSRLWTVDSDGGNAHELFPGRPGRATGFAWSTDGRRLIVSEGPSEPTETFSPGSNKLYVSDALASGPTIVDTSCTGQCFNDGDATFSADGRQIVFSRVIATDVSSPPPVSVIATMDLATGRVVELDSTKLTVPTEGDNSHPRFSPDGKQIVFVRGASGDLGSSDLYLVNADGTSLRRLSLATRSPRDPEWSPDGSLIVFSDHARLIAGNASSVHINVYVVRPDGTGLRQLTTDDVSMAPSWTQDGRILFVRIPIVGDGRAEDFWLMDADGHGQLALGLSGVAGQCCASSVAWQPIP